MKPSGLNPHLEPSVSCGEDVVGVGAPGGWFGFGEIVLGDEAVDRGLQVDDRMKHAMLEPAPRQFGEEPFYSVQPGGWQRSRRITSISVAVHWLPWYGLWQRWLPQTGQGGFRKGIQLGQIVIP